MPAPREQPPAAGATGAWAAGRVSAGGDAWAGRPLAGPGAPPTIGDRFLARLIDTGIQLGILLVLGGCANTFRDAAQPLRTLIGLVVLATLYGYEFSMLGRTGQTVGKRVMKLRVIKVSGEPVGWGAAAARVFVPMLASCFTCGIGGLLFSLSPLFDSGPWKRGWPDRIASTVVIRAEG